MRLALVLGLSVVAACSGKPSAAVPAAESSAPVAASSAQNAPASAAASAALVQSITGTVVETMDAATYTYVRVKHVGGEIWAATAQFKVAVGDRIVVPIETTMQNFHSQSLNRDFPVIYFASRITKEGEPAAAPPAMMASHGTTGMGSPAAGAPAAPAAAVTVTEPIAPPEGGLTIADVWAKRAALAGKTVTVRGKVMKFNGAILGRNWVHIQDGSGKAADATHDLTVTTDATVRVGDIVTAKGVLAIDKDFTAGYTYAAILESAVVIVK